MTRLAQILIFWPVVPIGIGMFLDPRFFGIVHLNHATANLVFMSASGFTGAACFTAMIPFVWLHRRMAQIQSKTIYICSALFAVLAVTGLFTTNFAAAWHNQNLHFTASDQEFWVKIIYVGYVCFLTSLVAGPTMIGMHRALQPV